MRGALHVVGFLIGAALLVWCVGLALRPENREQIERLREGPAWQVLALLGLSGLSLVLNGLAFWVALLPARRLKALDVLATNALATFLNYLPFKLGLLSRVLIHNRRDRVPLGVIGAWLAAVGVVMLIGLGPLVAASLLAGPADGGELGLNAAWFAVSAAGALGLGALAWAAARRLRGQEGIDRLHRWVDPLGLRIVQRGLRSRAWESLHSGFSMIAHGRALAAGVLLRVADIGVQAARFMVAAAVLGQGLAPEQAILVASVFFVVGVVSPVGMLGFREWSAAQAAPVLALASSEEFAMVALVVGGAEVMVNLLGAGIALAWLRPDRLLRNRVAESGGPGGDA